MYFEIVASHSVRLTRSEERKVAMAGSFVEYLVCLGLVIVVPTCVLVVKVAPYDTPSKAVVELKGRPLFAQYQPGVHCIQTPGWSIEESRNRLLGRGFIGIDGIEAIEVVYGPLRGCWVNTVAVTYK